MKSDHFDRLEIELPTGNVSLEGSRPGIRADTELLLVGNPIKKEPDLESLVEAVPHAVSRISISTTSSSEASSSSASFGAPPVNTVARLRGRRSVAC
jgi:hypothetical protein